MTALSFKIKSKSKKKEEQILYTADSIMIGKDCFISQSILLVDNLISFLHYTFLCFYPTWLSYEYV